jgi:hypothetical protein
MFDFVESVICLMGKMLGATILGYAVGAAIGLGALAVMFLMFFAIH